MAKSSETIDRVESKVDRLDEKLDNIDKTLVRQQAILEEHQRRSLANEESIEILRGQVKPLQTQADMAKGGVKLISLIGIIAGLTAAIFKIFGA